MMISEEFVWQNIWPTVERLIEATLAEDSAMAQNLFHPRGEAAALFDLFGLPVFDILLKTVLGRSSLAVTRAIETDETERGRAVHIEFVWPDPDVHDNSYTAADLVAVKMLPYRKEWRVFAVNPAAADLPLTEARAQGILVTSKALSDQNKVPSEPWLLPVALYSGNLQLPIREGALRDPVERLLLPGLQHRTYGVLSLIAGRRLWRDFRKKGSKGLDQPPAWAAAVEFLMGEQTMRETTQAAAAKHYQVSLTQVLPRIKQIRQTLQIKGLDERYSPLGGTQIVFKQ